MAFSGFQDFNPDFSRALQALIANSPGGISINSGYRTNARQAELFAQKLDEMGGDVAAARRMVAPPIGLYGSKGSRHTHRIAADLGFASDEARAWAHANAEKYGLNFRMGHEPWHIELAGEGDQTLVAKNDQTGATIPVSNEQAAMISPEPKQQERSIEPYFNAVPPPKLQASLELAQIGNALNLTNLMASERKAKDELIAKNLQRIRSYA